MYKNATFIDNNHNGNDINAFKPFFLFAHIFPNEKLFVI
jgi:hypothetical protein